MSAVSNEIPVKWIDNNTLRVVGESVIKEHPKLKSEVVIDNIKYTVVKVALANLETGELKVYLKKPLL